jgi:hypothetical protein
MLNYQRVMMEYSPATAHDPGDMPKLGCIPQCVPKKVMTCPAKIWKLVFFTYPWIDLREN